MTTLVCTNVQNDVTVPIGASGTLVTVPGYLTVTSGGTNSGIGQQPFFGAQPMLGLGSSTSCDATAFARWVQANGGVIPPYITPLN